MKFKGILFLSLTMFLAPLLHAQDTIVYEVSFPNAIHHEAEISVTYHQLDSRPLSMRMSVSSPGRYALHQFAKNVYDVSASDDEGKNIKIEKTESSEWTVKEHSADVTIHYTLFGDHADGTYAGIDRFYAHLNMPAVFMWAKGKDLWPIKVIFDTPVESDWKIATQLKPDGAVNTFSAPNFQYFMDSPVILGNLMIKDFDVAEENDIVKHFRIAINPAVSENVAQHYTDMIEKVVREERGVYGVLPNYDYGTYTFLCSYGPEFIGDGMEHRNSTMITSRLPLAGNENELIGTVAHEFFHCWNVERIRPKSLEPFNFEKTNMSGELWFAEGFTSYYETLVLRRCGFTTNDQFADELGRNLNYVINAPGTATGNPVTMSEMAPFADAAVSIDKTNLANRFTSYYSYGLTIGLALDLEILAQFPGKSLDDLMRAMWNRYGKTEISYTIDDIRNALAEVCGSHDFADDFFAKYIEGQELPDYAQLISKVGFKLEKTHPGEASLGKATFKYLGDTAIVVSGPVKGSSLYEAGLNQGDLVLDVNGIPLNSDSTLVDLLSGHIPGDTVPITFVHYGHMLNASAKLMEDPSLTLSTYESLSLPLNSDMIVTRNNWLESKALK